MTKTFIVPNLRTGYVDICKDVVLLGKPTHPRGMLTHELTDVTIQIIDPTDALPLGVNRKLNKAIAAAEALQLIAGHSVPELLPKISANFEQFMEDFSDGKRFWGAYGDRILVPDPRSSGSTIHQADLVVERLKVDPDSRQALIVLWRPELDLLQSGHADYPCTVMLMFLIRNGKLQLHVTMRSNDVWWGLAYDAFQFTQLQLTVAHALGVPAGPYFHHAISLHAYERDFEKIGMLHYPTSATPPDLPRGVRWADATQTPYHLLATDAKTIITQRGASGGQHPWWNDSVGRFV